MSEVILYCNPMAGDRELYLWCNGSDAITEQRVTYPQAEDMLRVFDAVLPANKQLDHIVFVNDAATFTTVRILAAICNALTATSQAKVYVIQSPVEVAELPHVIASIESVSSITPHYSSEPNISPSKKNIYA